MASAAKVQVFIDWHHKRCVEALQKIAMLADTGSDLHKERFNPNGEGDGIANGWRVAEAMRELANDAIGVCGDCGGSGAVQIGDGSYSDCPCEIHSIRQRCEANETTFDNNDMSVVLTYAASMSANVRELQIYKDAIASMALQFVHPKMTALDLAKTQLGIK